MALLKEYRPLLDEFLDVWPIARLKNMKLEEYTNVGDDDSFCRWLESRLDKVGSMWGGSAYKFGIYKRKDTSKKVSRSGYSTDGIYAWHTRYGADAKEAFFTVRAMIVDIAESAVSGEFQNIDKVDLGHVFKWKVAFHYNPKLIVPIFMKDVLVRIIEFYGENGKGELTSSEMYRIISKYQPKHQDIISYGKELWEKFGPDKMFFFVKKFVEQAKTEDQTTKDYPKTFLDLTVKLRFGAGGLSKVPWLGFFRDGQEVKNGIYPVFLYYKKQNILILAYGLSATNPPKNSWHLDSSVETISTLFLREYKQEPYKYGDSLVYRVYKPNDLSAYEVENDLAQLVEFYKTLDLKSSNEKEPAVIESRLKQIPLKLYEFSESLKKAHLWFPLSLLHRYVASHLTKPFIILTGLSGSGKTKMAEALSIWISESSSQYCLIAVGSDWTNREPLLGYPNALDSGKYVKPDNGALDLILNATQNPSLPYFLILDEMNMSHVERYFADFLSAMESVHRIITLHPEGDEWIDCDVPAEISLPPNLFIIGTVNIDETTYMFSPKVLDRANVLEFRIKETEMESYLKMPESLNMNSIKGKGASMGQDFVAKANTRLPPAPSLDAILIPFFSKLQEAGAEFGYRTAAEINRFISVCTELADGEMNDTEIIDAVIMQKLLPKLHGSRKKLEKILWSIGQLCLVDQTGDAFHEQEEDSDIKYPLSYEKLKRMYTRVRDDGFTSYAEA
ncbi:MAG: DUF3578 domain-containing protein [Candidatus Marinimicrobia bacterium]|nr:DUF3578 domain-containing protein [Candidatus Neomarinimicrobiota bacterium]